MEQAGKASEEMISPLPKRPRAEQWSEVGRGLLGQNVEFGMVPHLRVARRELIHPGIRMLQGSRGLGIFTDEGGAYNLLPKPDTSVSKSH